jgi:hypothetical protein
MTSTKNIARYIAGGIAPALYLLTGFVYAGDALNVAGLNRLLEENKVENRAIKLREVMPYHDRQKQAYQLYLATVNDFYGTEQCCGAFLVKSDGKTAYAMPGGALDFKIIDIDKDGSDEIERTELFIQHGYDKTTLEILQFDGKQFASLYKHDGYSNEGVYESTDTRYVSETAELQYADTNNDSKNEVIEIRTHVESGKTTTTRRVMHFDGRKIIRE